MFKWVHIVESVCRVVVNICKSICNIFKCPDHSKEGTVDDE